MIDHSTCDHPATRAGRARCRRGQDGGTAPARRKMGATPKVLGGDSENRVTTPRDREKQCDVCGVERIAWRGTDPLSGLLLTVGDRCKYYVHRSNDLQVVQ